MNKQEVSILFVEDDETARAVTGSIIRAKYGALPFYSTGSAEEGLKLFRKHRHSIVMTDIKLEDSDGLQMVRSIRLLNPDTVIIFITGCSDIEQLIELKGYASYHFICKPLDCDDLFEILDRYIHIINHETAANERIMQKSQAHNVPEFSGAESSQL